MSAVSVYEAIVGLWSFCVDDPQKFFEQVLRVKLRRWQRRVCAKIRARLLSGDYRISVHIRSCHGAGKTWFVAGLLLWFIATRPLSRGLTTAPTWRQVEDTLWRDVASQYNGSLLRGRFGRLLTARLEIDKGPWFASGVASDKMENIEGQHSPTATIRIVDEAKAVEKAVFDSTKGIFTSPEIMDVWISTPSIQAGPFFELDVDPKADHVIREVIDVDELITDDSIPEKDRQGFANWKAECLRDWGPESPEYQSRVMAKYVDNAEGALFPMSWIERAMEQEFDIPEPLIVGMDCAGSVDGDENATAVAGGPDEEDRTHVRAVEAWHERDTMVSKGRAVSIARPLECPLRVDVIGIGKGIADAAAADGQEVEEYRASNAANDSSRFQNAKAEDAWYLRERLERGQIRLLSKDHPLAQKAKTQLAAMRYEIRSNGKIHVIDPPDSPDLADAIIIACSSTRTGIQNFYARKAGTKVKADEKREEEKKNSGDPTPWH